MFSYLIIVFFIIFLSSFFHDRKGSETKRIEATDEDKVGDPGREVNFNHQEIQRVQRV